jgi:hypothetical protein
MHFLHYFVGLIVGEGVGSVTGPAPPCVIHRWI